MQNRFDNISYISSLIAKQIAVKLSEKEITILNEWLKKDVRNHQLYEKIRKEVFSTHQKTKHLDVEKYWDEFKVIREKQKIKKDWRFSHVIKIAASILLIMGVASMSYLLLSDSTLFSGKSDLFGDMGLLIRSDGTKIPLNSDLSYVNYEQSTDLLLINDDTVNIALKTKLVSKMEELFIPYGKRGKLILSDGTKVWINSGSRLSFPMIFTGKERMVKLDGEAYFEVKRDEEFPFVVKTSNNIIRVLGTSFNVNDYSDSDISETVLVTGKVELSTKRSFFRKAQTIELCPNQLAYFDKNDNVYKIDKVDVRYFTSWINDELLMNKLNFYTLTRKLERLYNVSIDINEKSIENYQISGKLNLSDNLDDLLKVISNTIPIVFMKEDNTIKIYNKN